MAEYTGVSRRQLHRYQRELEEADWLIVINRRTETGGKDSNFYDFTPLFAKLEAFLDRDKHGANRLSDSGGTPHVTRVSHTHVTPSSHAHETQLSHEEEYEEYREEPEREENNSSIREASPKNDQTGEAEQGSPKPAESDPPLTVFAQGNRHRPLQPNREEASTPVGPKPSSSPKPLNRVYLNQAWGTTNTEQSSTNGMTAIGSMLPQPQLNPHAEVNPRPSATEAWQVLVDLLSDIAREFRDEAKLSESVSRAYHLMQHAKISDIGVFTAKIYEARAITKSRYATIKRRMPYFFSVLSDVCGLRSTTSAQPPTSG
jgi:hypothetical protein